MNSKLIYMYKTFICISVLTYFIINFIEIIKLSNLPMKYKVKKKLTRSLNMLDIIIDLIILLSGYIVLGKVITSIYLIFILYKVFQSRKIYILEDGIYFNFNIIKIENLKVKKRGRYIYIFDREVAYLGDMFKLKIRKELYDDFGIERI